MCNICKSNSDIRCASPTSSCFPTPLQRFSSVEHYTEMKGSHAAFVLTLSTQDTPKLSNMFQPFRAGGLVRRLSVSWRISFASSMPQITQRTALYGAQQQHTFQSPVQSSVCITQHAFLAGSSTGRWAVHVMDSMCVIPFAAQWDSRKLLQARLRSMECQIMERQNERRLCKRAPLWA